MTSVLHQSIHYKVAFTQPNTVQRSIGYWKYLLCKLPFTQVSHNVTDASQRSANIAVNGVIASVTDGVLHCLREGALLVPTVGPQFMMNLQIVTFVDWIMFCRVAFVKSTDKMSCQIQFFVRQYLNLCTISFKYQERML